MSRVRRVTQFQHFSSFFPLLSSPSLGLVVLLLGRRECERSSKKSVDHLSNLMVQVYLWVPGLWVVGSALRPSAKATSDSRRPRDVASHSEEVKHVQGRSTRWAPAGGIQWGQKVQHGESKCGGKYYWVQNGYQ